jgi:hypothetical protein
MLSDGISKKGGKYSPELLENDASTKMNESK